jgi:DNA-directed RNA polymerase subunit L
MKINIIENTKKKAIFEVEGIDHTIANLIRDNLNKVEGVKNAGYQVSHPLIGIPKFVIETSGQTVAMVAFEEAINISQKDIKKFAGSFAKA